MIECPWCSKQVHLQSDICPECKHEVLPHHLNNDSHESLQTDIHSEVSIEHLITSKFKCCKCNHNECNVKEVAMSGTGLSKILDIEHNHFLFVSCLNCGFVEIYNPDVMLGKKTGSLGTILDILFGN